MYYKLNGQKIWGTNVNDRIQVFHSVLLSQVYKIMNIAMQSAFTNVWKNMS